MGAKKKATGAASASTDAAPSMASESAATSAYASLSFNEVLEDLSSRFIVNLPSEEQASIQRICFQVEQAHWFYEDFLRPLNPQLPSFALRRFSSYLLHTAALTVPLIQRYISGSSAHANQQGLEAAFDEFMKYKTRVPVCGAVILNAKLDKCILVKGWKSSAAWGFPKGKINQKESERDCAVREVYEETGFDCGPHLPANSRDFMELTMREQKIRLYIVPGIDEETHFETQTRKEISKIAWFNLSDLPTWKKNKAPPQGMGGKFYLISPFIGKMKQWISDNRAKHAYTSQDTAPAAAGHTADDDGGGDEALFKHTGALINPGGDEQDQSSGLKALLGLNQQHGGVVEGKGSRMIKESGDDRGRQLLDLLRGTSAGGQTPGPAQILPVPQLDEREKGTASLLAALNAGAGKADQIQSSANDKESGPKSDSSFALLSLLNDSANGSGAPHSSTPLPAPRPQRTNQAQSLLNLISPSTSLSFSAQQQSYDGTLPRAQNGQVHPLPASRPTYLEEDRERDRAQKRDLLLSSLMSSGAHLHSPSAHPQAYAQPSPRPQLPQSPQSPPTNDQERMVRDFQFPPLPSQVVQQQQQQQPLLSLLNGQSPHPSVDSPLSSVVHQTGARHDGALLAPVQPANDALLSLHNGVNPSTQSTLAISPLPPSMPMHSYPTMFSPYAQAGAQQPSAMQAYARPPPPPAVPHFASSPFAHHPSNGAPYSVGGPPLFSSSAPAHQQSANGPAYAYPEHHYAQHPPPPQHPSYFAGGPPPPPPLGVVPPSSAAIRDAMGPLAGLLPSA